MRAIWRIFRVLAVVLLIAFLVGLGWQVIGPREPAFQGKTVSVWLHQFHEAKFNYRQGQVEFAAQWVEPTQTAVSHIGTNALPTLLNLVRVKDTALNWRAMHLLEILHLGRWKPAPETVRRSMALDGFIFLGTNAQPAVPALIELLDDRDGEVRKCAASCLGSIGPAAVEAVPDLLRHLTDPYPSVCDSCESSLGLIHRRPEIVIPALMGRLHGDGKKWGALFSLGYFGPEAKAAVPVILPLLDDPDLETRTWAAASLRQIQPEAAPRPDVK